MKQRKKPKLTPLQTWTGLWTQESPLSAQWQPRSIIELTNQSFLKEIPQRFFSIGLWLDSDESAFTWILPEGWLGAKAWGKKNLEEAAEEIACAFPGGTVLIQPWTKEDHPWFQWRKAGQRSFRWTCGLGDFLFLADPRAFRFFRKKPFQMPSQFQVFHRPREALGVELLIPQESQFQGLRFFFRPDRFWSSVKANEQPQGFQLKGFSDQGPLGLQITDPQGRSPSEGASKLLGAWFLETFKTRTSGFFTGQKWVPGTLDFDGAGVLEGTVFHETLTWNLQITLSTQALKAWIQTLNFPMLITAKSQRDNPRSLWIILQEGAAKSSSEGLMTIPIPEGPSSLGEILYGIPGPDRETLLINRLLPGPPLPGRFLAQALFWQEDVTLEKRKVRKRRSDPKLPAAALGVILPRNTGLSLTPRPSQLGSQQDYLDANTLILDTMKPHQLGLSNPGTQFLLRTYFLPREKDLRQALEKAQDPDLEERFYRLDPRIGENLLQNFTDRELGFILGTWKGDRWKRYVSKAREKRLRDEWDRCQKQALRHEDDPREIAQAWVEFREVLQKAT